MTLDLRGAPPLHLYAACGENRALGLGGGQPWHIPEDLRFFHEATAGRTVILGRVSFAAWPRATLDGRRPVVVTAQPSRLEARAGGARPAAMPPAISGARSPVLTAPTVDQAVALADSLDRIQPGPICVAGGERIYAEVLASPRALVLHLTLIHAEFPADRYFPDWRHLPWEELDRRPGSDPRWKFTVLTLALPAGPRGPAEPGRHAPGPPRHT